MCSCRVGAALLIYLLICAWRLHNWSSEGKLTPPRYFMVNHESVNGGTRSPRGGMFLEFKEGRKTVKVRGPAQRRRWRMWRMWGCFPSWRHSNSQTNCEHIQAWKKKKHPGSAHSINCCTSLVMFLVKHLAHFPIKGARAHQEAGATLIWSLHTTVSSAQSQRVREQSATNTRPIYPPNTYISWRTGCFLQNQWRHAHFPQNNVHSQHINLAQKPGLDLGYVCSSWYMNCITCFKLSTCRSCIRTIRFNNRWSK